MHAQSNALNRSRWRHRRASAVLALVLLVALAACGGGGGGPGPGMTPEPTPTPTAWALRSATEASLTAYFREALGPSSRNYLGTTWAVDFPMAVATAAPVAGAPAAVFSGTTLQEAGVDEADLIKSDGTQVFNLEQSGAGGATGGVLRRQRLDGASPGAALVPVDTFKVPFSANVRGTGMYLDVDRAQVLALGESGSDFGIYDAWFAPQSWAQGITELALIDASNPTKMQLRRTLRISAQLIGSRRLGSTLYLVLRSYPQVPGIDPFWPPEKTAANQAAVNALQAVQLLPTLSVDGAAPQPLVQAASCFTQEKNAVNSADIVTLVGIDLASATHRHGARCFTGGTEAFYMSDQSLYLATTRSAYSYGGAFPIYPPQNSTDIHKFALNDLDIAYRGSGNVIGHLGFDQNRKSFRMGEHNGALRVITQTAQTWGGWVALPPIGIGLPVDTVVTGTGTATTATPTSATTPIESPGHLSILQESAGALTVVGELPNAARPTPLGKPGEQLYASRFLGTRGFLVTYRLTDPLYVLDLSNPADPKVAGELQVDGYSDYLFPLSANLLLGVGKDAKSDGAPADGRFAWYQGVKVSLIDLSDPARPREAARRIIGRRGTDATVLRDHHGIALQTNGNSVRLSLPVSLHDIASPGASGAVSDYFRFSRTELQKFEVDLGAQTLVARPALASSLPGQRDIGNDRSLLWNDQVHYYQNGNWRSAGW